MKKIRPPFTKETAVAKVQAAEDGWNSKNPERISMAYTIDTKWRNRDLFFNGRKAVAEFLSKKWDKELHYKLKKYLGSFTDNKISQRFEYEWQDSETGQWKRTHGNEHWEFDPEGLMRFRDMSANEIDIEETERKFK